MKTFSQYLQILLAIILLFFLIKPFVQTQANLKNTAFQIYWHWLIPSFGVQLLYRSLYAYPFATLLSGLMEKHVSFRDAFTMFHLSNITRYLPGRIWGVVRLISLSNQFGVSKTATASSMTLHVGVETAFGGMIAMSLLLSKQAQDTAIENLEKISGHTLFLTLVVIGILVGILFCIPKVAKHVRMGLKTLTPLLKDAPLWMNVLLCHILLWCAQGIAFFLFLRSFASVQWADAGVLTACFAFAWVVGFLSFLTPGGLGIREGLLGLLLSDYMLALEATRIVLLCRVWMLSAEMLLAATAFLLHRSGYKRRYSHQTQEMNSATGKQLR